MKSGKSTFVHEALEGRTLLSTISVVNTNATGAGSLAAAITAANATSAFDVISFNIPGSGVQRISNAALPNIIFPITIDGTTQPGYAGTPLVELIASPGSGLAAGITVSFFSATIRGLAIGGYATGISVPASGVTIESCYLGLTASGQPSPNAVGIDVSGSSNAIGGTTAAARNVISNNTTAGVNLGGAQNLVVGNYIGTDVNGTAAAGNAVGINVTGKNLTIGGNVAAARNVISGNTSDGVRLSHQTQAVYDSGSGWHYFPVQSNNKLTGNYIGAGATGQALGNGRDGVRGNGFVDTIGTTLAGEGNNIAYNTRAGVSIGPDGGDGNGVQCSIRGNSIHGNVGLGIDLAGDGRTDNDPSDADTGPNNRVNFPVIVGAGKSTGGTTTVWGTVNVSPYQSGKLDFYSNAAGQSQGEAFLGSITVGTDGSGNGAFSIDVPAGLAVGQAITATFTDGSGNTSEFSDPTPVLANADTDANGPVAYPTPLSADGPAGSLVYRGSALNVLNSAADSDTYTLAVEVGQRLTATLDTRSNFQGSVTIYDPSGVSLGTFTAASGTVPAVAQGLVVSAGGTYTLVVSGVDGRAGLYSLYVELNAVRESESVGGAGNDTAGAAQQLTLAPVPGGAGGDRTAVYGTFEGGVVATTTDYYGLDLVAGDRLSTVLSGYSLYTGCGRVNLTSLALIGSTGQTVGTASSGPDGLVVDMPGLLIPATGHYNLLVNGNMGGNYALNVNRNVWFDNRVNTSFDQAQDLGTLGKVLGRGVVGAAALNYYAMDVPAGTLVHVRTFTPGDGPGEPVNALDPRLDVLGVNQTLIASDDNSASDGRNADLTFVVMTAGRYVFRLSRAPGTQGDYLLDVSTTPFVPTPGRPDLLSESDTGRFSDDDVTGINGAGFETLHLVVPNVTPGATVTLYLDGIALWSTFATFDSVTFGTLVASQLADGIHVFTAREQIPGFSMSPESAALSVTIDTVAPQIVNTAFDPASQVINVRFSEDVAGSLSNSSLVASDSSGNSVPVTLASYDSSTHIARFTFATGQLAKGDYSIRWGVAPSDRAGNSFDPAAWSFQFFSLPGDANRDRVVDFEDLVAIAQHYDTRGGATYAQGDLDGDGNVDFADLVILAQNFDSRLPDIAPAVAPVPSQSPVVQMVSAPIPAPDSVEANQSTQSFPLSPPETAAAPTAAEVRPAAPTTAVPAEAATIPVALGSNPTTSTVPLSNIIPAKPKAKPATAVTGIGSASPRVPPKRVPSPPSALRKAASTVHAKVLVKGRLAPTQRGITPVVPISRPALFGDKKIRMRSTASELLA